MLDFEALKNQQNSYESIKSEIEKTNKKKTHEKDTRYWEPTPDEAGNASAKFRFLPAPKSESSPFVKVFSYSFKEETTGRWYIEKSLSSINKPDPMYEFIGTLYKQGDAGKERAKKYRRKMRYHSNIYMISDTGNPENNGKVFLFNYGQKIFDKIAAMLNPEFEDEDPVNVFDFWKGSNFKYVMGKVSNQNNYDKSKFDSPSVLLSDDSKLKEIWEAQYSLQELLSEENFKSYDKLKERMDFVFGRNEPKDEFSDEDFEEAKPKESLNEQKANVKNKDDIDDDFNLDDIDVNFDDIDQ